MDPLKALGLRAVRSRYIDKGIGVCGVRIPVGEVRRKAQSTLSGQLLLPLPIEKSYEVNLH